MALDYYAIVAFAGREGHARPRRRWIENGLRIGGWAGDQRSAYRQGQLSADRIARLEGPPRLDVERPSDDLIRCANCGRTLGEDEGQAVRWGWRSAGLGELYPFCEECARREFSPDAPR